MHLLFKANQANEKEALDLKAKGRSSKDMVIIPGDRKYAKKTHKIPIDEFYNMVVDLIDLQVDFGSWETRSAYVLGCRRLSQIGLSALPLTALWS